MHELKESIRKWLLKNNLSVFRRLAGCDLQIDALESEVLLPWLKEHDVKNCLDHEQFWGIKKRRERHDLLLENLRAAGRSFSSNERQYFREAFGIQEKSLEEKCIEVAYWIKNEDNYKCMRNVIDYIKAHYGIEDK